MNDCETVEPLGAALVDGELNDADRARVEAHLQRCSPCRDQVAAQREARSVLQAHRAGLTALHAPAALRERCTQAHAPRAPQRGALAVAAATLVLVTGGWTLHVMTERSASVLAAQLAADHVKCHALQEDGGALQPDVVQQHLLARYGFDTKVPPSSPLHRFRLIGARRCLTGEGANAHILYEADRRPVSLYLLPGDSRPSTDLDVLGRRAYLWSRHNGTYVLVAEQDVADLAGLAAYVREATR